MHLDMLTAPNLLTHGFPGNNLHISPVRLCDYFCQAFDPLVLSKTLSSAKIYRQGANHSCSLSALVDRRDCHPDIFL